MKFLNSMYVSAIGLGYLPTASLLISIIRLIELSNNFLKKTCTVLVSIRKRNDFQNNYHRLGRTLTQTETDLIMEHFDRQKDPLHSTADEP